MNQYCVTRQVDKVAEAFSNHAEHVDYQVMSSIPELLQNQILDVFQYARMNTTIFTA